MGRWLDDKIVKMENCKSFSTRTIGVIFGMNYPVASIKAGNALPNKAVSD